MSIQIWMTPFLLALLLTACAPSNVTPTPTIIPLDRSLLTPTVPAENVADAPPTTTPIPFPSVTPTTTPFPTATLAQSASSETGLTPTPAQAEAVNPSTAPTATAQVEILSAGLNVRQGPGMDYPSVGTVAQGEKFDLVGISPNKNWLQINTPTGPGWISAQPAYTRIIGSLENVESSNVQPANPQPATEQANPGSKLIFATHSGGDLYSINTDGTGLRKLAAGVVDPVVSPDGQQVAFTRWDSSKFGVLYTLNLADGSERVVADEIRQPKSPAWSPDGQAIIVSFQHGGTVDPQPECREFDSDDGFQLPNVSEIVSVGVGDDGKVTICFIRLEDLQWGLRRVNLTDGKVEDLPADLYSFNPTWDPQNPWQLIYDGQRGLMQLDLNSGELKPFTTDVRDTAPVFSPNGTKLALTYKQHDHWEVYTYDPASGSRQRLTKPPLLADPQYNSAAPAWSPDGSQIAFLTDRSGKWEIWVMNADGSNPQPLFPAEVQAQLGLEYRGVNERLLNWVGSATSLTTSPQPVAAASAIEAGKSDKTLSGQWDFTFGRMTLSQKNMDIEGTYQWYGGTDTGQIKGIIVPELNQFQGLWISDRSPNSQGFLRWQLAPDWASFSGTSEQAKTGQWCGVRSGQPLPDGCGFSGDWQLHFGNPPNLTGQATLAQTGPTVQGTYTDSEGHSGEVDGQITVQSLTEAQLTGIWRSAQGEQDTLEWRLDLTSGRTFQGRRNPGSSEWCGWRQEAGQPEPCGF